MKPAHSPEAEHLLAAYMALCRIPYGTPARVHTDSARAAVRSALASVLFVDDEHLQNVVEAIVAATPPPREG